MPVHILIEEELPKEREAKQWQSDGVAKSMGVDTFQDQSRSSFPGDLAQTSNALCCNMQDHQGKETIYSDRRLTHNVRPLHHYTDVRRTHKDISESFHPFKTCCNKNEALINGPGNDSSYDMRKTIVGQKLLEGKYPASNQKLLHSKDFQDAFEVLSSNRDLFPACPEEPNTPDHFQKLKRSSLPRRAKCITLLKPPGKLDGRTEKRTNSYIPAYDDEYWTRNQDSCVPDLISQKPEDLSHPTRIVLLKPGLRQQSETKAPVTSVGSVGHLPEEITRQRQGSFDQRNEVFLSPMLSNGYAADTSTMYASGDEYTDDEFVDSSDLEYATPRSQNFCDLSRKSPFSQESPVLREAKKRLSKRFERLTSNSRNQHLEETRRSTSGTLGDMLAFPEMANEGTGHDVASGAMIQSCCEESKPKNSISKAFDEVNGRENLLTVLKRSNSAPSSCSRHEHGGLEVDVPNLDGAKVKSMKEKMKSVKSFPLEKKNVKSSFRGKVSNFFFSHGKKFGLEKPSTFPSRESNVLSQPGCDPSCGASSTSGPASCNSGDDAKKLRGLFPKVPFQDELACDALKTCRSERQNHFSGRISRSSPIESVTRSLSAENSRLSRERLDHSRHLRELLKADVEEYERIIFVKPLLSSIGIDSETQGLFPRKWHSLESPLDPALLEVFFECKEELRESQENRSNRRLVFDCVNAVLLESACAPPTSSFPLTEEVILRRLRELFSSEWKFLLGSAETSRQMVDRILRKEMGGKEWAESTGLETTELGGEIERQVLDQLLGEALDDFVDFCL